MSRIDSAMAPIMVMPLDVVEEVRQDLRRQPRAAHGADLEEQAVDQEHRGGDDAAERRAQVGTRARGRR